MKLISPNDLPPAFYEESAAEVKRTLEDYTLKHPDMSEAAKQCLEIMLFLAAGNSVSYWLKHNR